MIEKVHQARARVRFGCHIFLQWIVLEIKHKSKTLEKLGPRGWYMDRGYIYVCGNQKTKMQKHWKDWVFVFWVFYLSKTYAIHTFDSGIRIFGTCCVCLRYQIIGLAIKNNEFLTKHSKKNWSYFSVFWTFLPYKIRSYDDENGRNRFVSFVRIFFIFNSFLSPSKNWFLE